MGQHTLSLPQVTTRVILQPRNLAAFGIASGLVGVYLSGFHPAITAVLCIPVVVWGADVVRRIALYGLGTGVPSIGNLATSMGVLTALVGLRFQPVFGVAFAAATGLIYGVLISRFKILEIPHFKNYITELSVSACLMLMCLISIGAGGYSWLAKDYFAGSLLPTVFATGVIMVVYWGTSVALFFPYNTSLGAGERRERTLMVAIIVAGLNITLAGVARLASLFTLTEGFLLDPITVIIIGVIVWIYGMHILLKTCKREAASVTGAGIPPKAGK